MDRWKQSRDVASPYGHFDEPARGERLLTAGVRTSSKSRPCGRSRSASPSINGGLRVARHDGQRHVDRGDDATVRRRDRDDRGSSVAEAAAFARRASPGCTGGTHEISGGGRRDVRAELPHHAGVDLLHVPIVRSWLLLVRAALRVSVSTALPSREDPMRAADRSPWARAGVSQHRPSEFAPRGVAGAPDANTLGFRRAVHFGGCCSTKGLKP